MKLLLVEDDRKLAAAVRRGLVDAGYAVDVANDGNDGAWMADESTYDLVILDLILPAWTDDGSAPVCAPGTTGDRSCS